MSYLKESDKEVYKTKLNRANATEDYHEARLQLEDIIEELKGIKFLGLQIAGRRTGRDIDDTQAWLESGFRKEFLDNKHY